MAGREETDSDHNERKIPVFSVLKNGAILKNIFIVNNNVPPPSVSRPDLIASFRTEKCSDEENEEVVLLGRHPDCNIMLTHPSISRFHLQIHSRSSSQKLFVVDLSSVHGTWVSEKKIEPGARVEMLDGDTLRVGGSSRIYRLHWIPLSRAYDFQTSAVTRFQVTTIEKKEGEDENSEGMAVENCEKENSLLDEDKETQLQVEDSIFSSISPLYSDEKWKMDMVKVIPSAPPLAEIEGVGMSSFGDGESKSHSRNEFERKETELENLSTVDDGRSSSVEGKQRFGNENESPQLHSLPLSAENLSFNVEDIIMSSFFGGESKSPLREEFEQKKTSCFRTIPFGNDDINLSMVDDERSSSASKQQQFDDENESLQSPSPPSSENFSFNVEEVITSSFFGGEMESLLKNKFEHKEAGMTIPFENDVKNFSSMVDDEKSAPENGDQQFVTEIQQLNFMHLAVENLSLNDDVLVETQNRLVHEAKQSVIPLPVSQSQDIIENQESVIDFSVTSEERNQKLEILDISQAKVEETHADEGNGESNHQDQAMESLLAEIKEFMVDFSITSEERNQELEIQDISKAKVEEVHAYEGNGNLNLQDHVMESLLAWQSQCQSERCMESASEAKSNLPMNCNVECSTEEKFCAEFETVESTKGALKKERERKELSNLDSVPCSVEFVGSSLQDEAKSNFPMNCNVECSTEESFCAEFKTIESTKSALKKECERKDLSNLDYVPCSVEFVDSSLQDEEVSSQIVVMKESQTTGPFSGSSELSEIQMLEASPLKSENGSAIGSIWSRRGKLASFPRITTGISGGKREGISLNDKINHKMAGDAIAAIALFSHLSGEEEEEIFTPDKENLTPNTLLMKSLKKKAKMAPTILFSHLSGEEEEEIFTPDKENLTPNTRLMKSLKKKAKMDQSKPVLMASHKMNRAEELSQGSDKENQTPKILQERKSSRQISNNRMRLEKEKSVMKKGAERAPFQSLQLNFPAKSRSETPVVYSATKSNKSVNCREALKKNKLAGGEEKKHWTMVVDINSLLNKESMKSLQLLQGLKGTQLVIPRMVIRELDCLRRHGSLFRRTIEASSVLQWIEHCMVKTRWWIHVQSSAQEAGPTAPTPPATPQSRHADVESPVASIITRGSFMEILSPTAEDHILDCALHFRKMNEGQLVLLSPDVALKIKAMAEGLICETTKEFRESLVNPFSERFLWADSSPRGLTWCCSDDVVLRERYDHRCSLKPSKGGETAKGLKLILLHNSHYGR